MLTFNHQVAFTDKVDLDDLLLYYMDIPGFVPNQPLPSPRVVSSMSNGKAQETKPRRTFTTIKENLVQQKREKRRERNREHARRTRERKRAQLETLKEHVTNLEDENAKLREQVAKLKNLLSAKSSIDGEGTSCDFGCKLVALPSLKETDEGKEQCNDILESYGRVIG